MKLSFRNWKTTLAGVVVIAATGTRAAYPEYAMVCDAVIAIVAGTGLIAAKDHNVTGGDVKQ